MVLSSISSFEDDKEENELDDDKMDIEDKEESLEEESSNDDESFARSRKRTISRGGRDSIKKQKTQRTPTPNYSDEDGSKSSEDEDDRSFITDKIEKIDDVVKYDKELNLYFVNN